MRRPDIEPTATVSPDHGGGTKTVFTHPAYGQIRVSRVSGQKNLYGSDFPHANYVSIEIAPSTLTRSLSSDRPYADTPFVRLAMSEAQWATFVSSFNIGSGVQCTLEYAEGTHRPGIVYKDSADAFEAEADEDMREAVKQLDDLREKLVSGTSKLSKTAAADLLVHVDKSIRALTDSLPFVAEQFSRHMEKRKEKAKVEINAYIDQTVRYAGLEALISNGAINRPLVIDAPKDEDD